MFGLCIPVSTLAVSADWEVPGKWVPTIGELRQN